MFFSIKIQAAAESSRLFSVKASLYIMDRLQIHHLHEDFSTPLIYSSKLRIDSLLVGKQNKKHKVDLKLKNNFSLIKDDLTFLLQSVQVKQWVTLIVPRSQLTQMFGNLPLWSVTCQSVCCTLYKTSTS